MKEKWADVPDFPAYAVSNFGLVINKDRGVLKKPTVNQYGIPSVLLSNNGESYRRGVAHLVASAFLNPMREDFTNVINLDNNREDCNVKNLAWRPRWFALMYHHQFKIHPINSIYIYRERQTKEEFGSLWVPAMKYGLLIRDIVLATANHTHVFPTGQRFEIVD